MLVLVQTIFLFFFSKFRRIISTIFLCNKKYRSPCSFKRKRPSHLLRFPVDWEYSAMFEKERMFLHSQRFQNFRSAVFSFFATNFHLFFPTMPFETPIFLAYKLSGKESRHYILLHVIMGNTGCAVQYWGTTLMSVKCGFLFFWGHQIWKTITFLSLFWVNMRLCKGLMILLLLLQVEIFCLSWE